MYFQNKRSSQPDMQFDVLPKYLGLVGLLHYSIVRGLRILMLGLAVVCLFLLIFGSREMHVWVESQWFMLSLIGAFFVVSCLFIIAFYRRLLETLVAEWTIAFQRAKTHAEQSLNNQQMLQSAIFHELRTPLASIFAASQLMALKIGHGNGNKQGDEFLPVLDRIQRSVQQLSTFIEDNLSSSRMQTTLPVIADKQVAISTLFMKVAQHFELIGMSEQALHFSVEPGVSCLYGDFNLLHLLLNNLVENAIKYSPQESPVKVSAQMDSLNRLILIVQDKGIGIAANELNFVFEKNFRSRHVDEIIGSGLGLYIVKHIVMQHDGFITIDSSLGEGTEVKIVFPATRVHPIAS